MDAMLLIGLVVIAGIAARLHRDRSTLRLKLSTIEQSHTDALGQLVELTATLAARDEELAAFYAEEERKVARNSAVAMGYARGMN